MTELAATGSILVTLEPKGKLGETTVAILYDDETKGEANSLVFPVVVRHVERESGGSAGTGSGSGSSSSSSDHPAVSAIPKVSSGKSHTVALTTMGEIYTWGDNSFGQLGIGGSYRKTTTYAPDDTTGAVPTYLRPVTYTQGPVRVGATLLYEDGEKVTFTDVAAGDNFTLALDSRGRVWSWGDNAYWSWLIQTKNPFGAAKDESEELPVLNYHGEPVKDSGRALIGKLGRTSANNGDDWVDPLPGLVLVGEDQVLGEGTISIISEDGYDLADQPDPIVSIAAGKNFAMALSRSGRVYTWGLDNYGQLGQGEEFDKPNSTYAQTVVKGSSPSSTGSEMSDVVAIAAGSETAYAIRSNGDLWTWGSNSSIYVDEEGVERRTVTGQLGAGIQDLYRDAPIRASRGMSPQSADKVEYINRVVSVAAGDGHAVVLRSDSKDEFNGGVYGFGSNSHGQIGNHVSNNDFSGVPIPLVQNGGQHVAAGGKSTLAQAPYPAVDGAMTLLAWGDNSHGQLGTGVTEEIQVTDPETGLTETVTVNVNASGTPVDGAGTANQNGSRYMEIAWSISVGGDHMAFSINNGDVYASGSNAMGQLGDYTGRDSNIPVRVGDEGFSSLEIYGYLSNLGVSTGSAVSLDKTVEMRDDQQLTILMADPSAFDIDKGFNLHQHISAGTLEDGDLELYVLDSSILKKADGSENVFVFGGTYGTTTILAISKSTSISQMITVTILGAKAVAPKISVSEHHTVALRSDGMVFAWGDNSYGQLGDGTYQDRSYPVQVTDNEKAFTDIVDIAAGDTFTVLLSRDGTAWVIGELEGVTTIQREAIADPKTYVPDSCPNRYCGSTNIWGEIRNDYPTGEYTYTANPTYRNDADPEDPDAEPVMVNVQAEVIREGGVTVGYRHNGIEYRLRDEGRLPGYYVAYDITNTLEPVTDPVSGIAIMDGTGYVCEIVATERLESGYSGVWHCYDCNLTWNVTSGDPVMCECGYEGDDHDGIGCNHSLSQGGASTIMKIWDDAWTKAEHSEVLEDIPEEEWEFQVWYCPECRHSWRVYPYGNNADRSPKVVRVKDQRGVVLQDIIGVGAGADHALFLTESRYAIGEAVGTDTAEGEAGNYTYDGVSYIYRDGRFPGYYVSYDAANLETPTGYAVDEATRYVFEIVAAKGNTMVYAAGENGRGQLGQGDYRSYFAAIPVKDRKGLGLLRHITKVDAGNGFSLALSDDSTLWAWGANDRGQLGNDRYTDSAVPTQVQNGEFNLPENAKTRGISQVVNIAAGRDHAVAITYQNLNNGEGYTSYAFAWGASRSGQLGNGSVAAEGVNAPVLVRDNNDKPVWQRAASILLSVRADWFTLWVAIWLGNWGME